MGWRQGHGCIFAFTASIHPLLLPTYAGTRACVALCRETSRPVPRRPFPPGDLAGHRVELRRVKMSPRAHMVRDIPAYALAPYTSAAASLLVDWKEGGADSAAMLMRGLVRRALDAVVEVMGDIDVVPVPSHWRSRLVRGADPLAAALSGAPFTAHHALSRSRIRDQVGLSHSQRLANAGSAYAAVAPVHAGHPVVVLDDVITTGATVVSCAHALVSAGWQVRALIAPFAKQFH